MVQTGNSVVDGINALVRRIGALLRSARNLARLIQLIFNRLNTGVDCHDFLKSASLNLSSLAAPWPASLPAPPASSIRPRIWLFAWKFLPLGKRISPFILDVI